MSSLIQTINQVRQLFAPPPFLRVSDWADLYAYLPREGNAEPGKYSSSRMPYQRDMMDDAIDPTIKEAAWMIASQMGKTACVVNICGFFMDHDATSILVVYPTIDSGKSWTREKFVPMVEETPRLAGKLSDPRSRDAENTTLNKKFPGGNITICGANSPSGLRQRSKRVVIQDEIDAFEMNAEGDPCRQADKRAETFHNAVKIKLSTPTLKGVSRIAARFDESDKQYWFCKCPKCTGKQTLVWEQVRYPNGPKSAYYECLHCQAHLSDHDRIKMIMAGGWEATAPFAGIRGRHLNGLYRVIGKKDLHDNYLEEFVEDYLAAKKEGRSALMVWTNTFLALPFGDEEETIEAKGLMNRAEKYGPELPKQVLVLTAGVDIQADRAEIEVDGWGEGEESWASRYIIMPGNPMTPVFWTDLDTILQSRFKRLDGADLPISAACLDSSAFTEAVYSFCKSRFARRIIAVRGENQPGKPTISNLLRSVKKKCPYLRLGTDTTKALIYSRLKMEAPGPGCMHFPEGFGFDEAYYQMLTAEEMKLIKVKGFTRRAWHKVRPRNEALDIRVYSYSALVWLDPDWSALSQRLERKVREFTLRKEVSTQPEQTETDNKPVAPVAQMPARRPLPRRGFVNSWRS